jgi:hypothetical protein
MSGNQRPGQKEGARGGTLVPPRLKVWVEEGV